MNKVIEQLSSTRLTVLVLFLWVVTIIFSWWFIPPKVDDGIYLVPAISVLQGHPPSVTFGTSIEPIFFIFPTQPFLHGIFLKILNFLSVDLDIETYRLFNYISIVILFYLVYRLFSVVFDNVIHQRAASNFSLILLGLSQFSLQFFVNRPEVLGLVFFILGLIYFIKFLRKIESVRFCVALSSFYFGVSSILHPNFLLLSSFVFVYWIYIIFNTRSVFFLKYLTTFFIPVIIILGWFLINIEAAQDQLFNRVEEVASNTLVSMPSVFNIFSVIIGDTEKTFAHNFYLQAHMATLLVALLFLVFYLFRKENVQRNEVHVYKFFKILALSIFALLLFIQPFRPYYLLISFLSIITVVFFFITHIFSANLDEQLDIQSDQKTYVMPLIYLISISLPLSLPILHTMKTYLSSGSYYNHHKTLNVLTPFLTNNRHIFITTAQLLPLFSENISTDLHNTHFAKGRYIHWYFPVADTPGARFKELMQQDINIETHLMQGAIWGALIKTTSFNKQNTIACLSLKGGDFFINLYNPKILFKDKQNIFLTSSEVIPSNHCLNQ
jgi:hypothetical protein